MLKNILTSFIFLLALQMVAQTTVVDIIANSDDHNLLETAVLTAGLEDALSGDGPFTVFAPTDAAFDALPAGTLDALVGDPTGALTDILTYHVVGASVLSSDLSDGQLATTLNGKDIIVTIDTDGVFINNAKVTIADIEADNGIVHVLDAVLLPPTKTSVDVIVNSDDHNILEAAILAAGLEGTLSGEGPFTIFAPTDAAFEALPAGTVDALLADPSGDLTDILTYHVVGASVLSSDLTDGQVATTLFGQDIVITINADGVFINDAQVTVADIETDNGVVHVIDAVLLPMPVATDDINSDFFQVDIFPNPTSEWVNITSENLGFSNYKIITFNGQIVKSGELSNTAIEVNDLLPGSYIIELRSDQMMYTKKLIIR